MIKAILAIRFLFKRRISYFSVAAVALCVFVVFVVITVLTGLTSEFRKRTHLSVGDCIVSSKSLVGFGHYQDFINDLEKEEIVEAISPVIKSYAFIYTITESGQKEAFGSDDRPKAIMGIEPSSYSKVTAFADYLSYNKERVADVFRQDYEPNLPGCVSSTYFTFVRDDEGKFLISQQLPQWKVEISSFPLTAKGALAKAGAGEINTKTFVLSNVAQSRAMSNWGTFYLPFDEAQKLCGMATGIKRVNAIHIKFEDGVELNAGCKKVSELWEKFVAGKTGASGADLLEKVTVKSWETSNRHIIAAVETERTMMILIFGMIGVITVFVVFVVFYMIVSHKSKDIGILKSVGASNRGVQGLFLEFACFVGVIGSVIGAIGGWQFLVHINKIDGLFRRIGLEFFNRKLGLITDIPNAIDFKVLVVIILSAMAACLVGALVPSRQAARLKPVETLQVSQL